MITWDNFYLFALPAIVLWGAGAVFALFSKERSRWAIGLTLSGILVFAAFITGFGACACKCKPGALQKRLASRVSLIKLFFISVFIDLFSTKIRTFMK